MSAQPEKEPEAEIRKETASLPVAGTDTYTVVGPNCHQRPAVVQSVTFSVPTNRRIVALRQDCIDGPCGWSYNPELQHPRNYEIWYRLFAGATQAEWRRKHTSHPVTYRIYVDWETV